MRFSNLRYSFSPFRNLRIVSLTTNQKAWGLSQFENKTEQVVYGCPNKDTCFLNSTLRNTIPIMNSSFRVYLTFELKITIHIWCQTKLMKFLLKMKWIKKEQNHASSWTMPSPCWILVTKVLLSISACYFPERLRDLYIYSKIQSNCVTGIFKLTFDVGFNFELLKAIRRRPTGKNLYFKLHTILLLSRIIQTQHLRIRQFQNTAGTLRRQKSLPCIFTIHWPNSTS